MTDEDERGRDSGADRRSHERFDASIEVDYASGETFLFSYITNISEMGIFIRSDNPAPRGAVLTLRFAAPNGPALDIAGEVTWVNPLRPDGENLNPGMGVRFLDLTPEAREAVVDLVRTVAYLRDEDTSEPD
jgi:type IV pilus assembly protein PilZ